MALFSSVTLTLPVGLFSPLDAAVLDEQTRQQYVWGVFDIHDPELSARQHHHCLLQFRSMYISLRTVTLLKLTCVFYPHPSSIQPVDTALGNPETPTANDPYFFYQDQCW